MDNLRKNDENKFFQKNIEKYKNYFWGKISRKISLSKNLIF